MNQKTDRNQDETSATSVWRRDMSTRKFLVLIGLFCALLAGIIALPWLRSRIPDALQATESPETTLAERNSPDLSEEIKHAAKLQSTPEWPDDAPPKSAIFMRLKTQFGFPVDPNILAYAAMRSPYRPKGTLDPEVWVTHCKEGRYKPVLSEQIEPIAYQTDPPGDRSRLYVQTYRTGGRSVPMVFWLMRKYDTWRIYDWMDLHEGIRMSDRIASEFSSSEEETKNLTKILLANSKAKSNAGSSSDSVEPLLRELQACEQLPVADLFRGLKALKIASGYRSLGKIDLSMQTILNEKSPETCPGLLLEKIDCLIEEQKFDDVVKAANELSSLLGRSPEADMALTKAKLHFGDGASAWNALLAASQWRPQDKELMKQLIDLAQPESYAELVAHPYFIDGKALHAYAELVDDYRFLEDAPARLAALKPLLVRENELALPLLEIQDHLAARDWAGVASRCEAVLRKWRADAPRTSRLIALWREASLRSQNWEPYLELAANREAAASHLIESIRSLQPDGRSSDDATTFRRQLLLAFKQTIEEQSKQGKMTDCMLSYIEVELERLENPTANPKDAIEKIQSHLVKWASALEFDPAAFDPFERSSEESANPLRYGFLDKNWIAQMRKKLGL